MTADRPPRPTALLADRRVYLVATTPGGGPGTAAGRAWRERVATAVAAGIDLVQVRDKRGDTATRRAWLAALRAQVGGGARLVVNDDLDACSDDTGRVLADGLHLGRDDAAALGDGDRALGLRRARERLGADRALGTSTRTLVEVEAAVDAGVDHVGFGAMAASPTKSDTAPADPEELARCARAYPDLPIYPIGGVTPALLPRLAELGVRRVAVGSAVLDAPDPAAAARLFVEWSREPSRPPD